jgi:long-subunit fatty acid transport protein
MACMPYFKNTYLRFYTVLALFFVFSAQQAAAQAENYGSPYSRFGLGDQQSLSLAHHRGMGGITTTSYDSASLNLGNAASLSDLKLTSIEFGAIGNISNIATSNASQYRSNFNFGYLMFGFPVNKRWGTAIGFQPYSFTNYNLVSNVDSSFGSWREEYNGRGGLNQLSWSNGVNVGKGFHLGITATYLFGTINQERLIIFPFQDSLFLFNVRNSDKLRINDVQLSVGMQYRKTLKLKPGQTQKKSIAFGIVAELPSTLNASNSFVSERFTLVGNTIRVRDTVSNKSDVGGDVQLPWSLSAGFQYSLDNKLLLAVEGKYTNWSEFSQFGRPDSMANSMQFAAGMQYTPKYNAIGDGAKWKTMRYRTGIRYNSGALVLKGQQISELGMTFGVGIPMKRPYAMPYMNITGEIGQRGGVTNGLVRERYTRITLGLTLNDRWFIKRKYD